MTGNDIICIAMAYLLGGICFGYYLVRFRCRMDIREHGSGGVGARNVGRMLGKTGFAITLLGDAAKGMAAIAAGRCLHITAQALALAMFAVIAGHIWPLFLQFRGGRGIATAIGAYLVYDSMLALLLLGITILLLTFRRGFILSGLAAFLLLSPVAYVLDYPGYSIASLAGCSLIILFAHRERIRQALSVFLSRKEA